MAELKPGWLRLTLGEVVRPSKETCKDPEAAGINRVIGLEHLEPGDLRVRSWGHVTAGTPPPSQTRGEQGRDLVAVENDTPPEEDDDR